MDDSQKGDIDEKNLSITQNWEELKKFIEARIPLFEDYVTFHNEADNLQNLFKNLENVLMTSVNNTDFQYIDDLWSKIQNQFTHLKTVAKSFHDGVSKVSSIFLVYGVIHKLCLRFMTPIYLIRLLIYAKGISKCVTWGRGVFENFV